MKCLGEGIKQLPIMLKYFTLDLSLNSLGKNSQNIKYLGLAMK